MKKNDNRLIAIATCSVALLLGAGLWWQRMNAEPIINLPPPQNMPEPNAYDYYVAAIRIYAGLTAPGQGAPPVDYIVDSTAKIGMSPQQQREKYPTAPKIAWLKKSAPALQKLRQGFAYELRVPPQRSNKQSVGYARIGALIRLLRIESHARSEQGDFTGAVRSALDILHLGRELPRGGPLVAAMYGYSTSAAGRTELRSLLPKLDAATCRKVIATLEQQHARRFPFAQTLTEEKWSWQSLLREGMRKKNWRNMYLPRQWRQRHDTILMYLYSKQSIVDNSGRYLDDLVVQAKLPYRKQKAPALPRDPFNQTILPFYRESLWSAARDENDHNLLLLELALHAYRLEKGHLPESLSDLAPTYVKKVPIDAYGGGEPMRYRRSGDSYLLYSVGPDGKDDGGRTVIQGNPVTPAGRHLVQPESIGDFVSGINR